MPRLTPAEVIANNQKFILENNLESWAEIHAKVLEIRLAEKESN